MKCYECEGAFHVPHCTRTVTDKRFDLMTPIRKAAWKCETCKEPIIDKEIPKSPLMDNEYVTIRREKTNCNINVSTENSFQSLSIDDSEHEYSSIASPNIMNRSCPENYDCSQEVIKELENKIQQLQQKLDSADNEIINLLAENSSLVKLNHKYESKIKTLTQIYSSPIQTTPAKLKRKSLNRTQLNFSRKEYLTPAQTSKPKSELDTTLKETTHTTINETEIHKKSNFSKNYRLESTKKGKICIMSTNKVNKIGNIAEKILSQHYSLCHYLTPECGIKYMVSKLKAKLNEYTMQDFCVLIVGEEDFIKTTDIQELLHFIREALQEIKHTNIIVCAPTYKIAPYSNLYNWRVENFNKLLNIDAANKGYAWILDSNRNVTYDNRMFYKKSGSLNNHGMMVLIRDLHQLMNDILHYEMQEINTDGIYSEKLFR